LVQLGESGALCSAALLAGDNVIRMIDSIIAALHALRADIKEQNRDALVERVEHARSGRERWWHERQTAEWSNESFSPVEAPKASEVFGRLLGFGGRKVKSDK
jgi:hypothetical protein